MLEEDPHLSGWRKLPPAKPGGHSKWRPPTDWPQKYQVYFLSKPDAKKAEEDYRHGRQVITPGSAQWRKRGRGNEAEKSIELVTEEVTVVAEVVHEGMEVASGVRLSLEDTEAAAADNEEPAALATWVALQAVGLEASAHHAISIESSQRAAQIEDARSPGWVKRASQLLRKGKMTTERITTQVKRTAEAHGEEITQDGFDLILEDEQIPESHALQLQDALGL